MQEGENAIWIWAPIIAKQCPECENSPNYRDRRRYLTGTLLHKYIHALRHVGVDDDTELAKQEVEAEAVAYIVGRQFGLDTSGSALYLAAWQGEEPVVILKRIAWISRTATEITDAVDGTHNSD